MRSRSDATGPKKEGLETKTQDIYIRSVAPANERTMVRQIFDHLHLFQPITGHQFWRYKFRHAIVDL